jgi:Ca2+-transporting ATPase
VLAAYLVARNIHGEEVAVTTAFATLGLVQLAHALSLRSKDFWTFSTKLPFNKYLLVAIVGATVMQVIVIVVPVFNKLFSVTQLNWEEWLITIVASIMIIPIVDLQKWITAKFNKRKKSIKI